MASRIFDLPIAAVSLTDSDRQWFKSRIGVALTSIPRERAPCAEVAETASEVIITDLLMHDFYALSPLAESGVRFYAGVPLVTRDGYGLGALCVLGPTPRATSGLEMAALRDLADMVMSQIELQHAFGRIDPLSGFPNRTQFLDDLEDLGRDMPDQRRLAVVVDLARNEQLDHGARVMGASYIDTMVREAAQSLRTALGPDRIAYHVASTQFAFLAKPDADESTYPDQLLKMLGSIAAASEVRFALTATIGLAPFTTGEDEPADVLRMAFSAALEARSSETAVSVYSSAMDRAHQRSFRLINDFGTALEASNQLRLMYQPRVDAKTGTCLGVEALLRWRHPLMGDISPAEFVPIIEHTPLVRPLTAWVLDTALKQLAVWRSEGLGLMLSVNLAATNLIENDLVSTIQLLLLKHGVRTQFLELEVTEGSVMSDSGLPMAQLAALKEVGIQLAIDDFGTGYSSLAYLRDLPVHTVKIDQSFIRNVTNSDGRAADLVRSMIGLIHDMGYNVVAEGVEDGAAAKLLAELNCDELQGYYFSRPMEAHTVHSWIKGQLKVREAA